MSVRSTIRHQDREANRQADVGRLVTDIVAGLPEQLAWARTHVSAWALQVLGPLSDAEEQRVLREITKRPWLSGMPSVAGDRFTLDGRWPELVEFWEGWYLDKSGRRRRRGLRGMEGEPMPLGLRSRWADQDFRAVVSLGRRVFDPAVIGSFDRRGELLIDDGLIPGLSKMGIKAHRTSKGFAGRRTSSDAVAEIQRGGQVVLVNIEGRNRRWEVLPRIPRDHRDRKVFAETAGNAIPTVVVAPRVTQRYRDQVSKLTGGLGGVVETGVYMAGSSQVIETLGGWAPWPMVLRLSDEVLERVAAELEAAADRYLAADLGPQVIVPTMMRIEDQELLQEIQEFRSSHWRCLKEEAAAALGVPFSRLERVWDTTEDRWNSWPLLG